MKFLLSSAVRAEGYAFRVLKNPARVRGGLGTGLPYMQARVYETARGKLGIACKANSWDHAYSVSHEIAEHRWGFSHTADMFCEQANLLALWLRER
jgi:hypothetical protein